MSETTPPPKIIHDLAVAYWASRCLHVVAELGIADVLGDEPQTAHSLAQASGTHPQALHRVLRALCITASSCTTVRPSLTTPPRACCALMSPARCARSRA